MQVHARCSAAARPSGPSVLRSLAFSRPTPGSTAGDFGGPREGDIYIFRLFHLNPTARLFELLMMRGRGRAGWAARALLAAAAVVGLERRTAADMACSLPEGPGLLAPKVAALPASVSTRCSDTPGWGSARARLARAPAGAGAHGRDIVVPDACETVAEALEAARAGDRVFVREGRFAWDHVAIVGEHTHIAGDDRSCLLGPWLLQAGTAGLFQGVCCAVKHSSADAAVLPDATVTSFSASWILEDCELRAVRAPVLRLLHNANMTLLFCNVGGVGGGEGGSSNDDTLRATDAAVVTAWSNLLLYRCRIEDTGDADSRPPRDLKGNIIARARASGPVGVRALHPYGRRSGILLELPGDEPQGQAPEFTLCGGVRLFDSAKARLEQCTASNNDVTLTLSGRASAVVYKSVLKCHTEAFALFRAACCQPKSRLVLRGNVLEGLCVLAHALPEHAGASERGSERVYVCLCLCVCACMCVCVCAPSLMCVCAPSLTHRVRREKVARRAAPLARPRRRRRQRCSVPVGGGGHRPRWRRSACAGRAGACPEAGTRAAGQGASKR